MQPEVYISRVPLHQIPAQISGLTSSSMRWMLDTWNSISINFLILVLIAFFVLLCVANDRDAPKQDDKLRALLDEYAAKQDEQARASAEEHDLYMDRAATIVVADIVKERKRIKDNATTLAAIQKTIERLERQVADPPTPPLAPTTFADMMKAIKRLEDKIDQAPAPTPAPASATLDALQQKISNLERFIKNPPVPVATPEMSAIKQQIERLTDLVTNCPTSTPAPSPELAGIKQQISRLEDLVKKPFASSPAPEFVAIKQQIERLQEQITRAPPPTPEVATIKQQIERLGSQIANPLAPVPAPELSAIQQQIKLLLTREPVLNRPTMPIMSVSSISAKHSSPLPLTAPKLSLAIPSLGSKSTEPIGVPQQKLAFAEIKSKSTEPMSAQLSKLGSSAIKSWSIDPIVAPEPAESEPVLGASTGASTAILRYTNVPVQLFRNLQEVAKEHQDLIKRYGDYYSEELTEHEADAVAWREHSEATQAGWGEYIRRYDAIPSTMQADGIIVANYFGGQFQAQGHDSGAEPFDDGSPEAEVEVEDNSPEAEENLPEVREASPEVEDNSSKVEQNFFQTRENTPKVEGNAEDKFEELDDEMDAFFDDEDDYYDDLAALDAENATKAAAEKVTSSPGTGLGAGAFSFEPSSPSSNTHTQAQTKLEDTFKTDVEGASSISATKEPNNEVKQTVTTNSDKKKPTEAGKYCGVCDEVAIISLKKHKEDFHGFCQLCSKEVRGVWSGQPFMFHYENHKDVCRSKPKAEDKSPLKPVFDQKSPATPLEKKQSATPQFVSSSSNAASKAQKTGTFNCRYCHVDFVAAIITLDDGREIANCNQHNLVCTGVDKMTCTWFYCQNCGEGVTNKALFHEIHLPECMAQARKKGTLKSFDGETGERLRSTPTFTPPTGPRADTPSNGRCPILGSKATPNSQNPQAGGSSTGRGPILGSKATSNTPGAPTTSTPTGSRNGNNTSASRSYMQPYESRSKASSHTTMTPTSCNVLYHHSARPTKITAPQRVQSTMLSTRRCQSPQTEGRPSLAQHAIQNSQIKSVRKAASLYKVPRTTLRDRRAGALPKAIAHTHQRKLQLSEEQSLVQWILDLDRRGFPPHIIDVRRMADVLLAARGQTPPPPLPVGKCWVSRWIKNQLEL